MMTSVLSFGMKSMICSAIFLGYYLFALRKARMHRFNRVYLLSAVLLSLLLPFSRFEIFPGTPVVLPDFPLLTISGQGTEEVTVNTAAPGSFPWSTMLAAIYCSVAGIMIVRLLMRPVWIYRLKRKGTSVQQDGLQLVRTADPRAPFSFMNILFWPEHMQYDSPEARDIIKHELAHIQQHHTLDKMLMQLMLAVCWLNPFNWLIKKELWLQHEFLADQYAIKDGNGEAFARMLLYNVSPSTGNAIINPFFQSPVKRRLLMLTKQGKNTFGPLRRLLSVPVLLIVVFLIAADTPKPSTAALSKEKIVLVLDAAHGGKDAGGKSIFGPQEKNITLALCQKLASLAPEYNIEIITTRNGDVFSSLQDRLLTSNHTNEAIFISVHVNKSASASALNNNYELGINSVGEHAEKNVLLASSVANRLKQQQLTVDVVDRGNAYVIRGNKHPALLIECGNLDNSDNMALLKDEAGKEKLCRDILGGIVDYQTRLATGKQE